MGLSRTIFAFVLLHLAGASVSLIYLKGSNYFSLGRQYGARFSAELVWINEKLQAYYVDEKGLSFHSLCQQAAALYRRYCSEDYQQFIEGMAAGSGLSLKETIVINGMETLAAEAWGCSFVYVPPTKSLSHEGLVARYYDYPPPFDQLSQHLSVTVIDDGKSVPVALVGIVGEFMCLTCVSKENIFISINNGSPAGGSHVNKSANATVSRLIEVAQNSYNLDEAISYFPKTFKSDYSLIINLADEQAARSVEATSRWGTKLFVPSPEEPFVSTNLMLNKTWRLHTPSEEESWQSGQRRDNLLELLDSDELYSVGDLKDILDIKLETGGARWEYTIYQVIYDFATETLHIRSTKHERVWQTFDLHKVFNSRQNDPSRTVERLVLSISFTFCLLMLLALVLIAGGVLCRRHVPGKAKSARP